MGQRAEGGEHGVGDRGQRAQGIRKGEFGMRKYKATGVGQRA